MAEPTPAEVRIAQPGTNRLSSRVVSFAANVLGQRARSTKDHGRSAAAGLDFPTAIRELYQVLLERDADVDGLRHWSSVAAQANSLSPVFRGLVTSEEYRSVLKRRDADPADNLALFPGYSDADVAVLETFRNPDAKPEAGFVVDFLGGRTRATSLWDVARKLEGQVLGLPVPSDYHAEAPEWIGVLRSVQSAGGSWVGMELGAGFGPWIVAGGNAARRKGIAEIRLCAVEADPQHFEFLRQNLEDNGFDPGQHRLLKAAVGTQAGTAFWPAMEDSREDWGSRPVLRDASGASLTDHLGRTWSKTVPVPIVAMSDLIESEPQWNMVHIDVQGHEFAICQSCIEKLNERVHWIIVGTHSRKLDGEMIGLLWSAGWLLENEKPSKFRFSASAASLEAMTIVDGIQVWKNPRLERLA
jgi:FkbM family methyltransferase